MGDATVAKGDAVIDLSLAGLEVDKSVARDSWIPTDTRHEIEAKEREKERHPLIPRKPKPDKVCPARRRPVIALSHY
jgi:hypothetical protein